MKYLKMTSTRTFVAIALLAVLAAACSDYRHPTAASGLTLNNGAKWKADSSTNSNVKNLLAIIEKSRAKADRSMTAYPVIAGELQNGLDKMVKECKMKGPDHDALHKWLEPLMKQVPGLKQAATEKQGAERLEKIQTQLNLYPQYFE